VKTLRTRNWQLAGTVVLAIAALGLALSQRGADTDISDTIGYVQAAHQLARGEGLAFKDPHNQVDRRYYMLYAFKVVRPGEPNRYFGLLPGVSVLAAVGERLTNDPDVVQLLTPIAAALLIVITFAFGTQLADAWTGLWASLILFSAPTFLRFSAALWSEIPSAACLYLGFALIILALRRARDDGLATVLSLSGGLIIGATFFVRFSNVAAIPAMLGLIGLIGGRRAYRQRRALIVMGALSIALVALPSFNALYYGSPLDTGYSPRNGWYDQPAFSWSYAFGQSFVNGYSVPQMGRGLLNALGGGAVLALIGIVAKPRRLGWWLAGTAFVLLLPYMFYAFAPEGLNARFIIPALPALSVLAGRGIMSLGKFVPSRGARVVLGVILAAALLYRVPQTMAALDGARQSAQANIAQAQRLAQLTEPEAVLLSYSFNDMIAVYGQRSMLTYRHMVPYDEAAGTYHYDQFESLLVDEVQRLLAAGTPVYYVVDRQPSLLHSFEILQRHFQVTPVSGDAVLYRVQQAD
jgi:hypothetical protein